MNFILKVSTLLKQEVSDINGLGSTLQLLFKQILGPVFAVIGVAAIIYAIVLGINYAKAEDADARKKVQGRLIGALIGAAIIIAGATLCFAIKWETLFQNFSGESIGSSAKTVVKYALTVAGL